MAEIIRIKETESGKIGAMNSLLAQQSPGERPGITAETLQECLANPNFVLLLVLGPEGRPVGMGTIFFQRNLARWIAEIHDVVVEEASRGQGLGERIVRELLAVAESFAAEKAARVKLYLTSRPSREAANALYVKLGFALVARAEGSGGTNLYKKVVGASSH